MRALIAAAVLATLTACGAPEPDGRLQLADYSGRWLVINYWATWCKPCIKEIPELNALASNYPQVAVLGYNFDGIAGEALAAEAAALGIAFGLLQEDPSGQFGLSLPQVLPTTLVIDPEGQLVSSLVGPQTLESLALATGQTQGN